MMLAKSMTNRMAAAASGQKRKLEDKGGEETKKNPKQRRLLDKVRQSPGRSAAKDSRYNPRGYLGPLTCGVCAARFSSMSREKFCAHMKLEHSLEVHYQCQACRKTFPDQRLLQNHKCLVLTAADDKQSKMQRTCTICQLVFSSLYDINLHHWSSHGAKAYKCMVCLRPLGSVANPANHVCDHCRRSKVSHNRRPFAARHNQQKFLLNKQNKKAIKKSVETAKIFQFTDSTHLGQHLAQASEDAEMTTDTAVGSSGSSNKEGEADTEKESSAAGFPSSDSDAVPASSPATEGSASQDTGATTTDTGTPCKKADNPKEVPETPSPLKPQSQFDTPTLVSKNQEASPPPPPPTLELLPEKVDKEEEPVDPQAKEGWSEDAPAADEDVSNACTSTVPLPVEKTNGKSFPCDFCSQSFASVSLVVRHRKQHLDNLGNWCRICRESIENSSEFGRHLLDCEGVRRTPVQSSKVAADKKEPVAKKRRVAEKKKDADKDRGNSEPVRRFHCDFCFQKFATIGWVIRHRRQHNIECTTCQICFLKCDLPGELGRHFAAGCALVADQVMPEVMPKVKPRLQSEPSTKKPDPEIKEAKSTKEDCAEKDSSYESLPAEQEPEHESNLNQSSEDGVEYTCDFCLQSFASDRLVIRHRKQHEGGEFNRSVERAEEERGGERSFQCDICGQNYASACWVMRHRRTHNTSESPYVCRNCNCTFKKSVEISHHLRSCHGPARRNGRLATTNTP